MGKRSFVLGNHHFIFGVQIYLLGPPWSRVLHNGTQFFKFFSVAVLLIGAAGIENLQRRNAA